MLPRLSPRDFVNKWRHVTVNERASAQPHFIDLCALLGQPDPLSSPDGSLYQFEKPLTKVGGGAGFADVWRKDTFAWEYKTKGKYRDLSAAYQQLLLYKEDLDNPPVLAACDIANYEVHVAYTGHKTVVERFTNEDLATVSTRDFLLLAFTQPRELCPEEKVFSITETIAADFAQVAQWLEQRGYEPHRVARFFMKLLFAMFAEDIGLLPNSLLTASIKAAIFNPPEFNALIRPLFHTMRDGGYFGPGNKIPHFNGGLFEDDDAIPLNADDLMYLHRAALQKWEDVEPAIFGTLLERSLNPAKRAQLGAHYTSREDIQLIIEPVLMQPLRRDWQATVTEIEALRPSWDASTGLQHQRYQHQIEGHIFRFMERMSQTRVLDPACGSGNFLYVALHEMKGLEKAVMQYATGIGLPTVVELGVSPHQFFGIETNPFAAELAQVVVWIGYLQWQRKNGFWDVSDPVLQKLDTIQCHDALLVYDDHGLSVEPTWPAADVIVGNPPFLGGKRLRTELGDAYVDHLFSLYDGRVARESDLVCYWFERARACLATGDVRRVGLLATQGIRGGMNRRVLEHIKQTGDIFMAWSDRPWILDGAAVHVSLVGFDEGSEQSRTLDGEIVQAINPNLTSSLNLTVAQRLNENMGIAFQGPVVVGPFDIDSGIAEKLCRQNNVNQRPNSEVIFPVANAADLTGRGRGWHIIDFGQRSEEEASLYEGPFDYVKQHIKPLRDRNRDRQRREYWWRHGRSGADLRAALRTTSRQIATPRVAKHRVFVWLSSATVVTDAVVSITREDDYFIGVLHSKVHELWARAMGTQLREVESGFRYTPTSTFETFPFPWAPGHEPAGDARVEAIAQAARQLVQQRDMWITPSTLLDDTTAPRVDLPPFLPMHQRTLTTLYNRRPDWLVEAHRALDDAVLDAYGWPHDVSDDELLGRLLALNLERAAAQGATIVGSSATLDEKD